jgi:hypothetical protein
MTVFIIMRLALFCAEFNSLTDPGNRWASLAAAVAWGLQPSDAPATSPISSRIGPFGRACRSGNFDPMCLFTFKC